MLFIGILLISGALSLTCSPNCKECWGEEPTQCYYCKPQTIWIKGVCSTYKPREIIGIYRECVVCLEYNYPTKEYTCEACPYAAKTCNEEKDFTCKTEKGFALGAEERCECVKGILYQGTCICQKENTYPDPVNKGQCLDCVTKYLHLPYCKNFTCPKHYYDDGEKCVKCHYSCNECNGVGEESCIDCATNFEFVKFRGKNICLCDCLMYESNEVCLCNNGNKDCSNITVPNDTPANGQSVPCEPGYQIFKGNCLECNNPKIININGICVCPNHQVDFQGICVNPCADPNSNRVSVESCQCKPGFEDYQGICKELCLDNEERNLNGVCVCKENHQRFEGKCLPCAKDRHFNVSGICVCSKNQEDFQGVCVNPCADDNSYRVTVESCQCKSGFEDYHGICKELCLDNEERNLNGVCICKENHQRFDGKCQFCENNKHFDIDGKCVCPMGQEEYQGHCVKKCNTDHVHYNLLGECECDDSYEMINSQCVLHCILNAERTFNGCECKKGFYMFHGKCMPDCVVNRHYDDSENCVCNTEFDDVGGY